MKSGADIVYHCTYTKIGLPLTTTHVEMSADEYRNDFLAWVILNTCFMTGACMAITSRKTQIEFMMAIRPCSPGTNIVECCDFTMGNNGTHSLLALYELFIYYCQLYAIVFIFPGVYRPWNLRDTETHTAKYMPDSR